MQTPGGGRSHTHARGGARALASVGRRASLRPLTPRGRSVRSRRPFVPRSLCTVRLTPHTRVRSHGAAARRHAVDEHGRGATRQRPPEGGTWEGGRGSSARSAATPICLRAVRAHRSHSFLPVSSSRTTNGIMASCGEGTKVRTFTVPNPARREPWRGGRWRAPWSASRPAPRRWWGTGRAGPSRLRWRGAGGARCDERCMQS